VHFPFPNTSGNLSPFDTHQLGTMIISSRPSHLMLIVIIILQQPLVLPLSASQSDVLSMAEYTTEPKRVSLRESLAELQAQKLESKMDWVS
jgi:hypothetical protein